MSEPKAVTIFTRGIATPAGGAYGAILTCEGRRKELSGGEAGPATIEWTGRRGGVRPAG